MDKLINPENGVSISSIDIAQLTGKNHSHVMRDIRTMLGELEISQSKFGFTYKDAQNKDRAAYMLPKRESLILASGYSVVLRSKVIDRLEELERQNNKPLTITDQIQLIAQGHVDIESRLDKIENNSRLTNQQECALIQAKNTKVYDLVERHSLIASTVHIRIWQLFKKKFSLPRYNELPNGQFQEGLQFINSITVADLV